MSMARSNGWSEAEVIVNYADGCAYSKYKMEEAFRPGGFLEKGPVKAPNAALRALPATNSKEGVLVKKEDVDVVVHEFEITKAQAERALAEHEGDLAKTLLALALPGRWSTP